MDLNEDAEQLGKHSSGAEISDSNVVLKAGLLKSDFESTIT